MNDAALHEALRVLSARDLEQRRHWYAGVAQAYDAFRPSYPAAIVAGAVRAAGLGADSRILEIGCGPGTATVAFAALGCSMVCLEPNPAFLAIARERCSAFPAVTLLESSFEEWPLQAGAFDAVLAASSLHWIPADLACRKAREALKPQGRLLLLWNKELQPPAAVQRAFAPLYARHAPALGAHEDRATQRAILESLGRMMEHAGRFSLEASATEEVWVEHSAEEYTALLCTYSPYLRLEPSAREALLEGMRRRIRALPGGRIPLTWLSAFHVGRPLEPSWN